MKPDILCKNFKPINMKELIQIGRVNIIDVSTVKNDATKNIAISEILKRIFHYKVENTKAPKTLEVTRTPFYT